MAESLLMIALSPTMTEGSIARWKLKENDAFVSGDPLCEVETDKASMDYEAPKSGVLLKILVPEGGKATVGQPIAFIGKAGERVDDPTAEAGGKKTVPVPEAPESERPASKSPEPPGTQETRSEPAESDAFPRESPKSPDVDHEAFPQVPVAPAGYPRSSPLARKIALELGVDLRLVRGRGPEGRVTEKDVRAAALSFLPRVEVRAADSGADAASARRRPEAKQTGRKRAIIAKRLSESFFSAPHYYLRREIRAERLLEARAELNQGRDKPISLNALLMKLAASVLAKHPEMNVYWRGESIEERRVVDIGLAVSLPDGLITPVVRDCDKKGLEEIDRELSALIDKAKSKGLNPEEYEGAGFTITNLGSFGVDEFTAIINPPGSAILAVGAINKKPVVGENDEITVARTLVFTLGCDHRSIDGVTGAAFLADFAKAATNPIRVIL
ncbi:Dihydrolipoyllysine-residue acetyltransferase component of pyruvate dehydrogenase complex [bioreactor metagenome]|uniref:Dihydrolipoamide acetyltransferase component of pyruvate dehydrogenase complex n=2 Tax=root TaxID=1 RepID=A0A652ZRL6_9SPIR|nr:Dihydrolipoyllysine-residue acetyltransferase component of pyruvatedehydrogenase complex (E2) [uncultured Spirochaetota bacterium]HOI23793.1 dihydrolipoamide acetyltransferase family protein [Spirochaetales bacterium]